VADEEAERKFRDDWLLEARRRADEIDAGSVSAVPGEDVIRRARELIE